MEHRTRCSELAVVDTARYEIHPVSGAVYVVDVPVNVIVIVLLLGPAACAAIFDISFHSPSPQSTKSVCLVVAGGTSPAVPADEVVAPSYSGTDILSISSFKPSPICLLVITKCQFDQPALSPE